MAPARTIRARAAATRSHAETEPPGEGKGGAGRSVWNGGIRRPLFRLGMNPNVVPV